MLSHPMAVVTFTLLLACVFGSPASLAQTPSVEILSHTNLQKIALGKEVILKAKGSNPNWFPSDYSFYANGVLIRQGNPGSWIPDRTGIFSITCQVNSQLEPPVISAPIQLLVANPPLVEAIEPQTPTVLFAPTSADLEVRARGVGVEIRSVRFFDGPRELGVVSTPPYRIHAESLRYRRPIKVIAEDDSGLTTELVLPLTIVGMPGDEFTRPFELSGKHQVTTVSNRDASEQSLPLGNQGLLFEVPKSIWWTWTAPESGTLTLSTEGSNFDTVMVVLMRTNPAVQTAFTRLLLSRNGVGSGSASRLKLQVRSGVEYRFGVGADREAFGGDIALHLDLEAGDGMLPPPNDLFALRTSLSGPVPRQSFSTRDASIEFGEHSCITNVPGGRSVWWEWTTEVSGLATITTRGSDFDTVLMVYTLLNDIPSVSALRPLAANDDAPGGGGHSLVRFVADRGTRYFIQLDGFWGAGGTGALEIDVDPTAGLPRPSNDSMDRRMTILDDQLTQLVVARGPAEIPGAPVGLSRALWWGWTSRVLQPVFVTTAGSTSRTRLGVYWYDEAGVLHEELQTDIPVVREDNLPRAEAIILAMPGREYLFGVADTSRATGEGATQLQLVPGPPLPGLPIREFTTDLERRISTLALGVDTSRRALLLGSPDLAHWYIVSTNVFEPGQRHEIPLGQQSSGFLKAYEWNNR